MRGVAKLSLASVARATKRAQGPCDREQTECSEDGRAVVIAKGVFICSTPALRPPTFSYSYHQAAFASYVLAGRCNAGALAVYQFRDASVTTIAAATAASAKTPIMSDPQ
jgi:hypothetical protein